MDREELCESLIIWMNTFNLQSKATTIGDLTDGVLMMQALHQIAPAHFTESWMSKIKADVGNNWRLKVNNLKKILKGILDFYSEVLGQQIHDFHMPDIQSIGEHNDGVELGRLLQLILGCAVNCEEKQEYIQRIMSMEESVQHSVMRAIQELMTKEVPSASSDSSDSSQQLKKTLEELNKVVGEKEELAQRCHELDQQVSGLLEEKTNLEKENESLSERINQSDSLDDPSTPAGRRYQMLQAQVEQFQDEMFRLEAARDDYRIKVELQEKEILDLQTKNEDLTKLAEEARAVKDEIEILRFTSDKVAKYEATIESYKKKMEELSDLKGQIKILEEKNTSYMETNMELEEEIRKAGSVKSQLEMYKRQAQELQMKSGEETKRADKAEFDAKRQQEKIQTLQQEKQRLAEERDSLKEAIDNLEGTRAQEGVLGDGVDLDSSGMVDLMTVPPEVKEKLIRLQHENKMLKLQRSENDDENSQLLQTMLEDANSRKNELESEVRILNQRTMELQAQIEDLQENQQKADDKSGSDLRNKLKETNEKYRVLEKDLQTLRNKCEEQESDNLSHVRKMKLLEDELKKKDDEMKVMEEKYKRYLEKARSVSKIEVERVQWAGDTHQVRQWQGREGLCSESQGVVRESCSSAGIQRNVGYLSIGVQVGNGKKEFDMLSEQIWELKAELRRKDEQIRITEMKQMLQARVNSVSKSVQVGNVQMEAHILKKKIEGLENEVGEYRKDFKGLHEILGGLPLVVRQAMQDSVMELSKDQNSSSFFEMPLKTSTPGKKLDSDESFVNDRKKLFMKKSFLHCDELDSLQETRESGYSSSKSRNPSTEKVLGYNLNLTKDEIINLQTEARELRNKLSLSEQQLLLSNSKISSLESVIKSKDHELKVLNLKNKQDVERAMFFSQSLQFETDSEKQIKILKERIKQLENQIIEKDEINIEKSEFKVLVEKQSNEIVQLKGHSAELESALAKKEKEMREMELYFKHITERLRAEARGSRNPTTHLLNLFLQRN